MITQTAPTRQTRRPADPQAGRLAGRRQVGRAEPTERPNGPATSSMVFCYQSIRNLSTECIIHFFILGSIPDADHFKGIKNVYNVLGSIKDADW
jgi:hypothetical protein